MKFINIILFTILLSSCVSKESPNKIPEFALVKLTQGSLGSAFCVENAILQNHFRRQADLPIILREELLGSPHFNSEIIALLEKSNLSYGAFYPNRKQEYCEQTLSVRQKIYAILELETNRNKVKLNQEVNELMHLEREKNTNTDNQIFNAIMEQNREMNGAHTLKAYLDVDRELINSLWKMEKYQ